MAVSFDTLYNEMFTKISSYRKPNALQRLYRGAVEFFTRSEVLTYDQTQNVVADQVNYTLSKPKDEQVIKRIKTAWYGSSSNKKQQSTVIDVDAYRFVWPTVFQLVDAYEASLADGLTTRTVVVPDMQKHQVSDEMMTRWGERGIMQHALWQIASEPDKPWSDKTLAAQAEAKYRQAVSEARVEAIRRGTSGDIRVVPRRFV